MMDYKKYKASQAKRFWGGEVVETRERLKNAFRFVKSVLKIDQPVLDIGTRDGWFVSYLKRKKFKDVTGLELVKEAVEYAQSQGRKVIQGDAHDLSQFPDEHFGAVFLIHSLEHCYDPNRVIANVHRILQSGGVMYIEVPIEKKPSQDVGHYCNFSTVREIKRLTSEKRFEMLKCRVDRLSRNIKHALCIFRKREQ